MGSPSACSTSSRRMSSRRGPGSSSRSVRVVTPPGYLAGDSLPTIEQFSTMTIEMSRRERNTVAITGAALFMVVLDNLIVASTLPAIQKSIGSSLDSLEWVLDAYILAFGVLMLSAAAMGERYGRRRMFL